jgi:hypothetical protein
MNQVATIAPPCRLKLSPMQQQDRAQIYCGSRAFVLTDNELAAVLNSGDVGLSGLQDKLKGILAKADADRDVVMLARQHQPREDDPQFDDSALVAASDDNGAYVQAWIWVPFRGTALDKQAQEQKCSECDGGEICQTCLDAGTH